MTTSMTAELFTGFAGVHGICIPRKGTGPVQGRLIWVTLVEFPLPLAFETTKSITHALLAG